MAASLSARLVDTSQLHSHTALQCLVVAGRHHGVHLAAEQLVREHGLADEIHDETLQAIAAAAGLELGAVRLDGDLRRIQDTLPAIIRLKNGNTMLLLAMGETATGPTAKLYDPLVGEATPLIIELDRLTESMTGEVFLIKKDSEAHEEAATKRFGLGHLVRELLQERRLFRDIAVAAAVMSFFALAPVVFWQLVVDRVLVYKNLPTLHVLVGGMAFVILFETLFGYLRRTLILVASARIDARLSTFTFSRLLNLEEAAVK